MQIVILGMHRSGTSALAGLLHEMGAYFGSNEISIGANEQNPNGFWERRDVRDINDDVLHSINCDWNCVNNFNIDKLSQETIKNFNTRAKLIIDELNDHKPWLLKEPRFCLLFSLWERLLEDSVCIHIYRNPLEIAKSLQARDGTPLNVGIAMWEKYTVEALYASRNQLNLFVSHEKLITQPVAVAEELIGQLSKHGFKGLEVPNPDKIEQFIDKKLYHEKNSLENTSGFLNQQQEKLFQNLKSVKIDLGNFPKEVSLGCSLTLEEFEENLYLKRAELDISIGELHQKMARKQDIIEVTAEQKKNLQKSLEATQQDLKKLDTDHKALKDQAVEWKAEARSLAELLNHLVRGTKAMADSNSWKIGSKIVSAKQKLLLRKSQPTAIHYVSETIRDYETWKKNKSARRIHDGPTHIQRLSQRPLQRFPSIDIVVCVHNALEDVILCLNSIIENTPQDHKLYIVNDGSEEETTRYLRAFKSDHPATVLLENEQAGGYTKAANKGMRECHCEYVVCLNSDTIVPRLWLNNIVECAESDPSIGIVGPLSNAASWQSVPERFDKKGDWAVNELENGLDVNQMAEIVYQVSQKRFPRVDFV
jgi:hypothetical protein